MTNKSPSKLEFDPNDGCSESSMSGISAPKGIMTFGLNGPKRLSFIDNPVERRRSSLIIY